MANVGGNFVNPAYASPQQIAALREYAKQLLTEQPVHHWAQGVGNIARALVGGAEARRADTEEQAANKEFAKQLMEATTSKDPSKLMAVMANPMAQPLQALLARQLLEWGPAQRVATPGGLSVEQPVPPWFGGTPVPTQRMAPPAPPSTPPASPVPGAPNAETSSVGDIVPGSRTVTGSPDSAFDALGNRLGITGLGALNKAGMEQAVTLEKEKAKAALAAAQEQTAATQEPVNAPIQKRINDEIAGISKELSAETLANPLTGKAGYVRAQIPGTPAYNLNMRLRSLESMLGEIHAQKLKATNPASRVMPQEIEDYKRGLGFDITDRQKLLRSLSAFQGGSSAEPVAAPAQGAFPANAAERQGGAIKVLRIVPDATQ